MSHKFAGPFSPEIMQVIYQTIPNFEYFSQSQKRLMLACFEEKKFYAGATIFPEGSEPK